MNIRGGRDWPVAHSMAAEQCASACAGFILPHKRWLSGLSRAIRSFTSCVLAGSYRLFMGKAWPLAQEDDQRLRKLQKIRAAV